MLKTIQQDKQVLTRQEEEEAQDLAREILAASAAGLEQCRLLIQKLIKRFGRETVKAALAQYKETA